MLRPREVVGRILRAELRVGVVTVHLIAEPVHLAAVDRFDRALAAVRDVDAATGAGRGERDLLPVSHADGHAVRAGEATEEVIEAPVLLDDEHHVLDRRPRIERLRVDGGGQRCRHPRTRPVDVERRGCGRHRGVVVQRARHRDDRQRDHGEREAHHCSRTGMRHRRRGYQRLSGAQRTGGRKPPDRHTVHGDRRRPGGLGQERRPLRRHGLLDDDRVDIALVEEVRQRGCRRAPSRSAG